MARWSGVAWVVVAVGLVPAGGGGCAPIVVHTKATLERERDEVLATSATTDTAHGRAMGFLQAGRELDRKHPDWAIIYYRDAALAALPAVVAGGVSDDPNPATELPAQSAYRRAVEYALNAVDRQAKVKKVPWTEILAQSGIGVSGRVSVYDAALWQEVLPARRFVAKGFHKSVHRGGIGAPVVIHMARSVERTRLSLEGGDVLSDPSSKHFPANLYRAASAVLRPGRGPGEPAAVLELHDPVREPDMLWSPDPAAGAPKLPMAYDMTIGLARQIHEGNLNLLGPLAALYPSEFDGRTGIFMADPYQPGKIPVVFVHGLMSSPAGWANALNELRGDPELRKRYQFWMFFYSTGNPILESAARLRESLHAIRKEFDPEGEDPALDRMMLVGHSMGGILSRLMISRSGDTLWNSASKAPPDEIDLAPDTRQLLMDSMFFEPVPSVARVVFVATPHHGSPMGDELIGRVASRLIRVPRDVLEIRMAVAKLNGGETIASEYRNRRYATSVAQLGLENPVLHTIGSLPIKETVPYHSIIGYNGKEPPLPEGGDGIVPYRSARIEGALSELIVPSDHSVQETEAAISEIRRILTLHYNEFAVDQRAIAAGNDPPLRFARPNGETPVRITHGPVEQPANRAPLTWSSLPLDFRLMR